MRAKDAIGQYGERVAARHLLQAGWTVLDRNWRCPEGELDIVATDGAVLMICEVKTRSTDAFGDPCQAVNWRKARRIRHLAACWLAANEDSWAEVRFDVISVLRQPSGAALVRHLEGAF
ncbi:MAG: YraN family protein [Geodermatophilaceae bacterium]|nr:YraN family protein [Geodermatophilaceae bacterium]